MAYKISDDCIRCGACERQCGNQAISEGEKRYVIDPYKCTECIGNFPFPRCRQVCPASAPIPDLDYVETPEALRAKWERMHRPARLEAGPGNRKALTAQKPFEKVQASMDGINKVFIVGCSTCADEFHTGGRPEVLEMKGKLEGLGKTVTGWHVIHTPCDNAVAQNFVDSRAAIREAQAILVMACGLGVQRVASWANKQVIPALNTIFIGREERPKYFSDLCVQCEECMLGWTGGICPISQCGKNLVNGPCGGTKNGMCEIDNTRDCVWTRIYQGLEKQGKLELMTRYQPFRDHRAPMRVGLGKLTVGGK